ncbi:MAG: DUF5818 domain-containing protein [Bryobacteraceae bacterium]|jgi:hypothetical protein
MKKALILTALTAWFSYSAMAADITGYVIDQKRSSNAAMRGDTACANKCIKAGSPAVLVTDDGKIYKLTDQAKVIPHAGEKVSISGKMTGDTITVDAIKNAS